MCYRLVEFLMCVDGVLRGCGFVWCRFWWLGRSSCSAILWRRRSFPISPTTSKWNALDSAAFTPITSWHAFFPLGSSLLALRYIYVYSFRCCLLSVERLRFSSRACILSLLQVGMSTVSLLSHVASSSPARITSCLSPRRSALHLSRHSLTPAHHTTPHRS